MRIIEAKKTIGGKQFSLLPDGNISKARSGARTGVRAMVQGAGRPHAHSHFEFARGQPRSRLRLRHRETFSDRAADHFAPPEESARDAVCFFGAARDIHVLPSKPEMPGGVPKRRAADHEYLRSVGRFF